MSSSSLPTVSFDFDGTLTNRKIADLCYDLSKRDDCVVIITTRRYDPSFKHQPTILAKQGHEADDVLKAAKALNVDVYFTSRDMKYMLLQKIPNVIAHVDDDYNDVALINAHCTCKGFCWLDYKSDLDLLCTQLKNLLSA